MSTWAGNLIWLARDKAGLSQRELAERAGTSQPTIAAYEAGRKEPAFSTLVRIIRAAGLDLRTRLVPYDDHDDELRRFEASLPKEVVERSRRLDRELIEKARRARRVS
ncbi:MAG TPA: helix-turn-helix transcriptional regulator [Actinomycetota bacterium]|jgi:transcriptional regulator with XRE-family HTH domain